MSEKREMEGALVHIGVVVTRPTRQAGTLERRLKAEGARVIRFPVLDIVPPESEIRLRETLARISGFSVVIFVSANAVEFGVPYLASIGGLPSGVTVAAVGKATSAALRKFGLRVDLLPSSRYDSEGLLALPALQPEAIGHKHVLIFRGEGGREHLAETLRARGATVEYAQVYRRVRPSTPAARLLDPLARGEANVIIVTSGEGLRNLVEMAGDDGLDLLLRTPLVVVSERLADLARNTGFRIKPIVAPRASDEDLVATLVQWRTQRARVVRGLP